MTSRIRAWKIVATLVVTCLSVQTAMAIRFPGKAAADRKALQPLRQADAAAIFSGSSRDSQWEKAAEKLSRRCRDVASLSAKDCDPQLRCGWLAVRARAFSAWTSGDLSAKADAAAELMRAADRLAAGGSCGRRGEDRKEWLRDRKAASIDAGLALLNLIVDSSWEDVSPILPVDRQRGVESLIAKANRGGLSSVPAAELDAARADLRAFWNRTNWLQSQPALVSLRRLLREMWSPHGGIPVDCGGKLFSGDLLEDQWRGYLVREIVPEALSCLVDRLPAVRRRIGSATADRAQAVGLAEAIERAAIDSRGGRGFAADPTVIERLNGLRRALAPVAKRASASSERPAASPKKSAAPHPVARPAKKVVPESRKRRSKTGTSRHLARHPSAEMLDLARRAGRLLGRERELSAAAEKARTPASEKRILRRLVIETHRKVCAPLEEIDPGDIEHAKSLLEQRGWSIDSAICHQMEDDPALLSALITAAPGLVRVRAVALMRAAVRYTALDRAARARQVLASVPHELRTTSWHLLAAWAARRDGDPVAAEKELARIDARTLDRLRASGNEDLARLVAHAWVVTSP